MNRRNAHAVTDNFVGVKFAVDPDFVAEGGGVVFVVDENIVHRIDFRGAEFGFEAFDLRELELTGEEGVELNSEFVFCAERGGFLVADRVFTDAGKIALGSEKCAVAAVWNQQIGVCRGAECDAAGFELFREGGGILTDNGEFHASLSFRNDHVENNGGAVADVDGDFGSEHRQGDCGVAEFQRVGRYAERFIAENKRNFFRIIELPGIARRFERFNGDRFAAFRFELAERIGGGGE